LLFHSSKDLANKIFLKKQNVFKNLNLTIVTCSNWLAKESEKSFLLNRNKIVVIPNPINSDLYKPLNKKICKQKFNIPQYKKVILTGAANLKDKRKGFNYLIKAINILINKNMSLKNDLVLVVFGQIDKQVIDCISIETIQLGRLNNELDIIDAYNVADVFVLPSLQDNLPNTIMESLSCGVPVVAFNVGGIPDMIDDRQNGILAKVESVAELANGIEQLLTDEELHKKFSIAAREKVIKNFDQKIVAEKYLALYNSVKI
jgi:glycosyltransferase involved in cell wall biosynthesis